MKKQLLFVATFVAMAQATTGCGSEQVDPISNEQPAAEAQNPQPEELGQKESEIAVGVAGCAGNVATLLRYYSAYNNNHDFTTTSSANTFYSYEFAVGALFDANFAACGAIPLYKYHASSTGDVLLTTNRNEVQVLNYYTGFGAIGYCFPTQVPGTIPLYRYFSPAATNHLYTTVWSELYGGNGYYNYEGVACYVYPRDNCPTDVQSWRGGSQGVCACGPSQSAVGNVWGTDIYTDNSNPCRAAAHRGILPYNVGTIRVTMQGPQNWYQGSTRNGITSYNSGWWYGSYTVTPD